ncbi:chromosome segregation protein SMC [Hydrogenivirga sp. 128-5-R1-1]|uniref:chromosome segregation protein SMC n=1 Tax=Hydrogenivirga sp. 128-5-R1-1 TaxID=392423 RepID=UPI00015EF884|nr:chromosome segregation protein SMC [Hydrogenivirga sp. 128-5-R1-1]EDP75675.1 citrate synthase [Hydrogenivirga sp. 128-5-R1-1]
MKAFVEKIVVEGFKSYGRELKEIPIGSGFVAIVGPNGAGKSNIGDALSFALGIATTKTLRAKNLSYLIFSRDGEKAPYAYVEVHFRNEGAFPVPDENVVVSRKVTKDGRSTFKVNGVTVREKDLKDFLSKAGIYENGYNVVLQGDIVKFLKMTPVERRKVIEDVAGISEYEAKKQRAINDLMEVDIKIRELKLLLEEIRIQLDKLKEEKDKLEKYRKLQEEKRDTEIAILSKEIKKFRSEEEKLSEELEGHQGRLAVIKEEIREKEAILSEKEEKLKELSDKLLPFRERVGKISSDIEHIGKEIDRKEHRREEALLEREKEEKALGYLLKDLENLREELGALREELELKEREYEELKAQEERAYNELRELDDKLKVSIEEAERAEEKEKQLKEYIEKKREEENSIRLKLKEIELKIERTHEDIEKLKEEKEETKRKIEESFGEVEKYRRMRAVEQDTLRQEREYLKRVEQELKETRKKIEEAIRGKAYVESKLASSEPLDVLFEGIEGVYGTVGDLITVKDPEHIRAVEVAGGGRLRYVVVEDENVAKRCIDFLRSRNLGRMSFIPLNRIRADVNLPPYPRVRGAVDFAINLVEYEDRFERAVRFAFGDTLIVQDFESAKSIGIGNYRMVTLEGELFEKSGVITGGSQRSGGELGRKFYEEERRKLDIEEQELREKEQDILVKLRAIRSEIAEKEGVLKVLEKKLSEFEELSKEGDRKLAEFDQKVSKAEEFIEVLRSQEEELRQRLKELKEDIEYSEEKLSNLILKRQDIINYYRSSGIEENRQEYERIKRRAEAKRAELEKAKLAFKDKESEIKSVEEEVQRKRAHLESLEAEAESLNKEVEELRAKREELENRVKDIEAQVYQFYKEKDRTEEEVRDLQAELGRLRVEEEDLHSKVGDVSANLSRVQQKLTDLEQRLEELNFEGELPEVKEGITKLKERLFKIERELEHLGNVNLKADEDYNEELERYQDYEDKHRKLQEERKAIKEMIEEIETKKLRAFTEAFENINKSLKKIFSFLSPGGRAQMMVENEIDPFSGGISLVVKPRGKDVQYLEAMSGGEKTLAALSLIFAIQEYKPSPFYYFDEVDAHLDEANAKKVGELIKEKSKEAQFIVVTLREVLATFADRLIGVSARGGISRVFPVENLSSLVRQESTS